MHKRIGGLSKARQLKSIVKPVLFLLLVLVILEIIIRALKIPKFLVPTPSRVLVVLVEDFYFTIPHAWITLQEIVIGFALAVITGVILGVAISLSALFRDAVYPLIVITQVVPKVAMAPLFVIWFGYGMFSKVFLTFIIAFFPVCVNTISGLIAIEPEMLDLVRSYHASNWQVFTKLRLPTAIPYIITGMEVAIALSSIGALVAEFVGAGAGLGYLIVKFQYQLNAAAMFAIFAWASIIGFTLWVIIVQSKNIVTPWYVKRLKMTAIKA